MSFVGAVCVDSEHDPVFNIIMTISDPSESDAMHQCVSEVFRVFGFVKNQMNTKMAESATMLQYPLESFRPPPVQIESDDEEDVRLLPYYGQAVRPHAGNGQAVRPQARQKFGV